MKGLPGSLPGNSRLTVVVPTLEFPWLIRFQVVPHCVFLNSSLASLDMFTIGMSVLLCLASLLHYFTSRRPDFKSWISLGYMYGGGGRGR